MPNPSKYRKLARRSGIAGVIIWIAWAFIGVFFTLRPEIPALFYVSSLAQWLVAVLTIPAIVIGVWGLRGLSKKELAAKYLGYALFGIFSGIMSIVLIAKVIIALAYSLD
jgi:hypothetical protein